MSTKHTVLLLSGTISIVLILANIVGNSLLCGGGWGNCVDYLANIERLFTPLIPVFIISAFTYFLPENVYKTWLKFAVVWVPLSMIAILVAPEYSSDFLYPVEKGSIAFISSALFVVISILLVGWSYFRKT